MLAAQVVSIILLVLGLSHVLWSGLWSEIAGQLMRSRQPATAGMIGGMISLVLGLLIVLSDPPTQGALVITVVVGWAVVIKGAMWLLLPGVMVSLVPRRPNVHARVSVFWGVLAIVAGIFLARAAFSNDVPTHASPAQQDTTPG